MGEAKRDANQVPTLLGVSNADGTTPVTIYVDPTTHRMLVSGATTANHNETPTGTINGSNKVFTLANAPSPAGSLMLFRNRLLMIQDTDYTLSTLTITYTFAPPVDTIHRAWYNY